MNNDATSTETVETEKPVVNEQQAQMAMETLRSEQNLLIGTLSGFIASMAGAGIWAGVTIATDYQIGWMAVGIGFLVGLAVRFGGKGIDPSFGIAAAGLSLLGCVVGNVVTIAWFVADSEGMTMMSVLSQLDFAVTFELLLATFEVIDLLFYALAAYFGYKYAFRQITQEDFDRALGKTL